MALGGYLESELPHRKDCYMTFYSVSATLGEFILLRRLQGSIARQSNAICRCHDGAFL